LVSRQSETGRDAGGQDGMQAETGSQAGKQAAGTE
jgi:hypothetical protein